MTAMHFPLRLILFGLVLLNLSRLPAEAQGCADLPPSVLQFHRPTANEVIEHTVPAEEIARLSGAPGKPPPHPLMAMAYTLDSHIRTVHRVLPTAGGYCDAPEVIVVSFGIVRRDVYMVPEAAAVPCIRAALLAHEAVHDRVMDRAALDFIEQHRAQLARVIEMARQRPAPDEASAKASFEVDLLRVLGAFTGEFGASARGPLRQAVDSPAEMAHLDGACHGALGAMTSTVRLSGTAL